MSTASLDTPFPTLEQLRENPRQAADVLARAEAVRCEALALRQEQNVIALHGDEGFAVRDGDNRLVSVVTAVRLQLERGHLHYIDGQFVISAAGYDFLNATAGVVVMEPPSIALDGQDVPNPYVQRDPAAPHVVLSATAEVVALGRSNLGQIMPVRVRVTIEPKRQLLAALDKAAAFMKDTKKPIVTMLRSDFDAEKATGKRAGWMFVASMTLDDGDQVGLAADLSHEKVAGALKAHRAEVQFLDRKAKTIATRNALKKVFGLAKIDAQIVESGEQRKWNGSGYDTKTVPVRAFAIVPVVGFAPDGRSLRSVGAELSGGWRLPEIAERSEVVQHVPTAEDAEDVAAEMASDDAADLPANTEAPAEPQPEPRRMREPGEDDQ